MDQSPSDTSPSSNISQCEKSTNGITEDGDEYVNNDVSDDRHSSLQNIPRRSNNPLLPPLLDDVKQEKKEENDMKMFAKNTMNELLGLYGYERVAEADFSQYSATAPEGTSPHSSNADSVNGISPTSDENKQKEGKHTIHSVQRQTRRIVERAVLALPSKPTTGSDEEMLCSWCRQAGTPVLTIQEGDAVKSFCSEKCFAAGRRAKFKKTRICNWCKQIRQVREYLEEANGEGRLQFCSSDCLENYKMTIFCSELRSTKEGVEDHTSHKLTRNTSLSPKESSSCNLSTTKDLSPPRNPDMKTPTYPLPDARGSPTSDQWRSPRKNHRKFCNRGMDKSLASKKMTFENCAPLSREQHKRYNKAQDLSSSICEKSRKRNMSQDSCYQSTHPKTYPNTSPKLLPLSKHTTSLGHNHLKSRKVSSPTNFKWNQVRNFTLPSTSPGSDVTHEFASSNDFQYFPTNVSAVGGPYARNDVNMHFLQGLANAGVLPHSLPLCSNIQNTERTIAGQTTSGSTSRIIPSAPVKGTFDEQSFMLGLLAAGTNNHIPTTAQSFRAEVPAFKTSAVNVPSVASLSVPRAAQNSVDAKSVEQPQSKVGQGFPHVVNEAGKQNPDQCGRPNFFSYFPSPMMLVPIPVPVPIPIPLPFTVFSANNVTKLNNSTASLNKNVTSHNSPEAGISSTKQQDDVVSPSQPDLAEDRVESGKDEFAHVTRESDTFMASNTSLSSSPVDNVCQSHTSPSCHQDRANPTCTDLCELETVASIDKSSTAIDLTVKNKYLHKTESGCKGYEKRSSKKHSYKHFGISAESELNNNGINIIPCKKTKPAA